MPVGPTATQRPPGSYPISEGYTDARLVGINYSLHRWNEFLGLQLLTALLLVVGASLFGIRHRQALVVRLRSAWSWAHVNPYKFVLDLLILVLVMASGVVFLPIMPVSANSSLAGELIGVHTRVDEANYRIVCENGGVDELGMYYANTPDYGWLSGDDQVYISGAFGAAANFGAGLLTAKQAYYVWYFHSAPHSTTTPAAPNLWAMRLAGGYCANRPSPQPVQPHHVWINALGTVALVTHGDCTTLANLFRKIDGRWKIVRIDEIQQCPELG